jgi:hypothetical protein
VDLKRDKMTPKCKICKRDYSIYGSDGICDECSVEEYLKEHPIDEG